MSRASMMLRIMEMQSEMSRLTASLAAHDRAAQRAKKEPEEDPEQPKTGRESGAGVYPPGEEIPERQEPQTPRQEPQTPMGKGIPRYETWGPEQLNEPYVPYY